MAASPRISGKKRPIFTLAATPVSYADDLISITLENEDGDADVITFLDAENGGSRQFYIRGTAVQSTAAGSLWKYNWDNSGSTGVAFNYAPNGNATPSVAQPHYFGTLTVGSKPTLGGDASTSNTSAFTFDFEFAVDGVPSVKTTV